MNLIYSSLSPYARKVLVLAHEAGIIDRLTLQPTTVVPTAWNEEVGKANPLGKIPTLVLLDGTTLFDSRVIVEYLDDLHGKGQFFPKSGVERWRALKDQALADGILDAALSIRYELALRPEEKRWPDWIEGQMRKIRAALDGLEQSSVPETGAISISQVAAACALGYLDFRFQHEQWRITRPRLASFYDEFSQRGSMVATQAA